MVDTNTVIEGTVKFRDGKKWKSRWCVMRKLSPVADCLHLQLYRDSKDRFKQGQTKASLSLQHFLGVQSDDVRKSPIANEPNTFMDTCVNPTRLALRHYKHVIGFTLDKESNTIAIICQDVTVVLAFDTRERLIQWQVKIAGNLGEDEQFLVQISSAPLRAKLSPGPALLHVLKYQFCLTVGVPPRLVSHWQISHLRRYGVVESRFCFEGGSRCGKEEGLYVLVTDQGDEITRTFRLAAEGKQSSKKRPASRSASDSPKKSNVGRPETRLSDISCLDSLLQQSQASELRALEESFCECECYKGEDVLGWHSSDYTRDFADTSSVTDNVDSHFKESRMWAGDTSMERCASCISKLGAVSRSSTAIITPNLSFLPAWTMEANKSKGTKHEVRNFGETNQASENTQVIRSECSISEKFVPEIWNLTDKQKIVAKERYLCCPPERPPKPGRVCSQVKSPINGSPKRSQDISSIKNCCNTSCSCNITVNPYDNYDVPSRGSQAQFCFKDRNKTQNLSAAESECYDTPKSVTQNILSQYGNYDTPPPVTERKQIFSSLKKNKYLSRVVVDNEDMQIMACPCQRMMCWAENWMVLPYCRRGNDRENTAQPLHKKADECGDQFLCNNLSSVYATVDKSKKTRNRQSCNKDNAIENPETHSTGSELISKTNKNPLFSVARQPLKNTETAKTDTGKTTNDSKCSNLPQQGSENYMNSCFLQSLEFYENSKSLRDKSLKQEMEVKSLTGYEIKSSSTSKFPIVHNVCKKCNHEPKLPLPNPQKKQDDYLMMEPSSSDTYQKPMNMKTVCHTGSCTKHVPGYLPMHPVGGPVCINTQDFLKMRLCQQLMSVNDRAASSPSLTDHSIDRLRKSPDLETYRISGTRILALKHSVSATNSPFLRRRVLSCVNDLAERETNNAKSRKMYLTNSNTNSKEFDISSYIPENCCGSENGSNLNGNAKTKASEITKQPTVHSNIHVKKLPIDSNVLEGHDQLISKDTVQYETIDWEKLKLNEPIVHIRSSSVPSKSSHNRDSSSSNDSGVSSCSMKRQTDLAKHDMLVGGLTSSKCYTYTRDDQHSRLECFHLSLPRKSKSVDPLRDIAFQFQKVEVPMKSSSAEAEVPVCQSKQDAKGCLSPGAVVPYIDSRSTSSGTSDMSDYFETLSLSSYSSSDTHDSLHFGYNAVSTMKPRSGREYQKMDRSFLDENTMNVQVQPTNVQNINSNQEGTS